MRIELYQQAPWPCGFAHADIRPTLERVAGDIDHQDLVVTLGLTDGWRWRGTYHPCLTPADGTHLTDVGKTPANLPACFPCITLLFGTQEHYPSARRDTYGWLLSCARFIDMVATVWAHECYHWAAHQWPERFPGEDWQDEQAANRWALARDPTLSSAYRGRFAQLFLRVRKPRRAIERDPEAVLRARDEDRERRGPWL
jgi:hypothetical protein